MSQLKDIANFYRKLYAGKGPILATKIALPINRNAVNIFPGRPDMRVLYVGYVYGYASESGGNFPLGVAPPASGSGYVGSANALDMHSRIVVTTSLGSDETPVYFYGYAVPISPALYSTFDASFIAPQEY